jgi:cytochrome c peroxidase
MLSTVHPGKTRWRCALIGLLTFAVACTGDSTAPTPDDLAFARSDPLADQVRTLAAGRGIVGPLTRPAPVRGALVQLGQALLFDPILSGNRDISCMTCHHPTLATGDARHLSIGQGATGLGTKRVHPQGLFIPRNAPPLFNLHVVPELFWDGRVAFLNGQFTTPAGAHLTAAMTSVFEFGAVSALGLFPVTSREEMRAFSGNELANIADGEFTQIWQALMARLGAIPAYRQMFEAAYPATPFANMTFAHASNAMAGFMVDRLSFNNTPWDRFLAGQNDAISREQLRGAHTFLVQSCSTCHRGPNLANTSAANAFANVAVAQLGPGQGDGPGGNDDFGRERVTGLASDRYKFRVTPLRNVELTGPYGHAGQFTKLRDFIDHYSDSGTKLVNYNTQQLEPLLRNTVVNNFTEIMTTRSALMNNLVFSDSVTNDLTHFMFALTDPAARKLDALVPASVPSGLPVQQR